MRLRERMKARLAAAGVELRLETEALRLVRAPEGGSVRVELAGGESLAAKRVFNVGYARLNDLSRASGLDPAPLKYELAERALMRPPPQLEGLGVTVMDGPFFSILPFPATPGLSSLTHVRYTPHYAWTDEASPLPAGATAEALPRESRWRHMAVDGRRYLPCLNEARWAESRFETKAILLRNEFDESRILELAYSEYMNTGEKNAQAA